MFGNISELEEVVKSCCECKLCKNRQNTVFGVGNINADIMFIGESPSAEEDKQGIPFIGKAGKLLDFAFETVGINKDEVYITNIIKCRTPSNREPQDDEINSCLNYLRNQVILVKPKVIVLLGNTALKNILGKEYKIEDVRGKWIEKKGILYMCSWHPIELFRDEDKKIDFIKDLQKVQIKCLNFKSIF